MSKFFSNIHPAHAAFFICLQTSDHQDGAAPFAVGEAGVGKTTRTKAFAKAVGRAYSKVIGSQRLPEDILGAPRIVERDGCEVQTHATPEWLHNLKQSKTGGVLHLDELTDSQPAMQAAMLSLLEGGMPGVWIGATGNPVACSTNGYDLGLPVINRLCRLDWPEDRGAWRRGMLHGWDSLSTDFPVLPKDWQTYIVEKRALIVDFIDRSPDQLQKMPRENQGMGEDGEVQAWASVRSWTRAATVLAAAASVDAGDEIEDMLVQGLVGQGGGLAFRNWVKELDLPDPESLLADPSKYNPGARGDLAFTILCSVIAAVMRKNTPERWLAAWEVIERQAHEAADIAAAVCGPLAQKKPKKDGKPMDIPKSIENLLYPILQASA